MKNRHKKINFKKNKKIQKNYKKLLGKQKNDKYLKRIKIKYVE